MGNTIEIWESGEKEKIMKEKERLQYIDSKYRIIHRSSEGLERYFRNHTAENGYG